MENINYVNNILFNDERKDFVSQTLEEEENQLKEDLKKRRRTLIGLGSFYVILLLASFTFLV